MDISFCDSNQGLEHTMKKRKLEHCDDAPEDSNMSGVRFEDASLRDHTLSEMVPTPDATFIRCSKLESEAEQSRLEIFDSEGNVQENEQKNGHKLLKNVDTEQNNGHKSSETEQSQLEVFDSEGNAQEEKQNNGHKLLKNMDTEHENVNDSGNLTLNKFSVKQFVANNDTEMEEPSSMNTKEYSGISEDDHTKIPNVAQESSKEMIDGRNDVDIIQHCTKKFSDSGYLSQCIEQDHEKDGSSKCSYVSQINVSCGNGASEKVVKGVMEEASVCETSSSKELITLTPSCKPLELENPETVKEEVACFCFSAQDETSNGIDAIVKENTLSVMSDISEKGDTIDHSRKKLIVLDVNGLLADFISYVPQGFHPDIMIGSKAVFKRPFCDDFLKFCFERFEVGVWSSRIRRNVDMVIDFLLGDFRQKLLFCWDQSHCTDSTFDTVENKQKPLLLKELRKLWKHLPAGKYDASNTLLLDDSPHKALCNPANTAIFPVTYRFRDTEDTSLGPGGDLRVYLEGLSVAENVQSYVKQNPYGQRSITERNPSWKFYRRVIYYIERKRDRENATSSNSRL